jgi:hypothetical protein
MIGRLTDAAELLCGTCGTVVEPAGHQADVESLSGVRLSMTLT